MFEAICLLAAFLVAGYISYDCGYRAGFIERSQRLKDEINRGIYTNNYGPRDI